MRNDSPNRTRQRPQTGKDTLFRIFFKARAPEKRKKSAADLKAEKMAVHCTIMKDALQKIYDILETVYGPQKCFLHHENAFQLLIATILSAQCTDKKVNAVTPALFERWPDAAAFAACDPNELEAAIHPCGFYRAKAKSIVGASRAIMERFGGKVPDNIEDLTSLPGVGRKTANVVLGDAFSVPGLPVDTHVRRISNLLGVADTDDPEKIESILCSGLAPDLWAEFSHLLILHGRTRCPARRPDCPDCEIRAYCRHGRQKTTAKTAKKSANAAGTTKKTVKSASAASGRKRKGPAQ